MEQSIFDSELIAMNTRLQAGLVNAAPVSLESLGTQMREAGVASENEMPEPASNNVTIKLIINPDSYDSVSDWLVSAGCEIVSGGPSVLVANIDVTQLKDLELVEGIQRVEASRRLELRMQDARGPITNADTAISNHSLTGEGVVVGVIDSGVDWSHQDFIDVSNGSRIERFIHAERAAGSSTSTYSTFDNSEIDSAIGGGSSVPMGDPNGHGTHCAGIAAGNGRASSGQHAGIATQATIMAMRSNLFDDEIITGIRDFFNAAGNRPAVINLSLGGHWGAHDGTSAIENVIAAETGPGRIIVVAAGNEGSDQIHWNDDLVEGETLSMIAVVQDAEFQFVDVWIPRGDDVDLELSVGNGVPVPIDGMYHNTANGRVGGVARVDPINKDQNVTIFLDGCTIGTEVQLNVAANSVTQGFVHAWSGARARNVFPAATNDYSIGMPATEDRAISVASCVSRNRIQQSDQPVPGLVVGGISGFSSLGPTRYEVQKPDIAAPGQFITAALAANSEMANSPDYASFRDAGGELISIQGTSMATPFVTGVIALMLEREPNLDPTEIKQRFRATATRNVTTGRIWNNRFGVGRIDVAALLDYPN